MTVPDWPGTFTRGYIVRRSTNPDVAKRWPEAWFRYASDAEAFQQDNGSNYEIVDQESGRKVVGTSGHGNAILETLRRKGEL